jgi:hypothetical protein
VDVASFSPANTFSAMVLLQASICWSAGVASALQSGLSWLRYCAGEGAGHSAAASGESSKKNWRVKCRAISEESFAV